MPCRGGHSGILGPDGNYMAGPVDDTAQIVHAEADLDKVIEGKLSHDLTGHYNRFDVFTLQVRTSPRQALRLSGSGADEAMGGIAFSDRGVPTIAKHMKAELRRGVMDDKIQGRGRAGGSYPDDSFDQAETAAALIPIDSDHRFCASRAIVPRHSDFDWLNRRRRRTPVAAVRPNQKVKSTVQRS